MCCVYQLHKSLLGFHFFADLRRRCLMTELLLQIFLHFELSGACMSILLAIKNFLCNYEHMRWIKPWGWAGYLRSQAFAILVWEREGRRIRIERIWNFWLLKARNVLTLCMVFNFKPTVEFPRRTVSECCISRCRFLCQFFLLSESI